MGELIIQFKDPKFYSFTDAENWAAEGISNQEMEGTMEAASGIRQTMGFLRGQCHDLFRSGFTKSQDISIKEGPGNLSNFMRKPRGKWLEHAENLCLRKIMEFSQVDGRMSLV